MTPTEYIIHDRCVLVRSYTFQDLLLSHPNGWLQIKSGKDSEVCLISDKSSEQRTTDDVNEDDRERVSFE